MKNEKAVTCLQSVILAFLLSFSGIACLVSGFGLGIIDLRQLALWCLLSAAMSGVCFSLKLGLLPPGVAAVALGYLLQSGRLVKSANWLIKRILWEYEINYRWGLISVNDFVVGTSTIAQGPALIACVWGVLTAMAVAWAVCRRKTAVPCVLMSLLPMAACLVVADTVPDSLWLYLLLLGVMLLLLTHTVRRKDAHQGNRVGNFAVLPVALALLLLFCLVAKDSQQKNIVDTIVESDTVQTLWENLTDSGAVTDVNGVDLTAVGVRKESYAQILQVTADYDSTLYLRSRAMDSYDGVSWTDSGTSTKELQWPEGLERAGEVTISTKYAHRMLYLPYYVNSMDLNNITVGAPNSRLLTQYSFSCSAAPTQAYLAQLDQTEEELSEYLHLEKSVTKWAQPLAQQITQDAHTVYKKAIAIAAYVRACAGYDTNTQAMPSYKKDFVQWFLESSDTGYCVHFASSAAVLLQAAGIPARYVTGYMVQVKAGEKTVVDGSMAHAWVEYWLPGFGWTVLEATPSAAEQTPTVLPSDEAMQPEEEMAAPYTVLLIAAAVLALIGLAELQRYVRRMVRAKRRSAMDVNAQAVSLWQEAAQLARLLGQTPDAALFALAQEAKFSQHTLEQAQLQPFHAFICTAREQLKRKNLFRRIYYRIVLAVY